MRVVHTPVVFGLAVRWSAGERIGMANRRRVLGDEWVDASLAKATPFNADFQAMITRIAWHEIWGRPGLDDRTRRLHGGQGRRPRCAVSDSDDP